MISASFDARLRLSSTSQPKTADHDQIEETRRHKPRSCPTLLIQPNRRSRLPCRVLKRYRVKAGLTLPVLQILPDGSYSSVLVNLKIRGKAREALIEAARAGEDLDEGQARYVRVVEYEIPDRDGDGKGEVIALVTTITEMTAAAAPLLAEAYHQRWEHETGNRQLKTYLRGPGKVLRSKSPDMVRQEIYGYLLTHYALSALICRAATEAGIDPDRVKFKRTVRIIRRRAADPAAFPP